MAIAYVVALCLVILAFSYQLRFTEATLHIGRALTGATSGTGLQDAVTPPASAYVAFVVYGLTLLVLAFGFYQYGIVLGFLALVAFVVATSLNRLFLLPRPDSAHFREIVIKSMIRRHANYLRDGDQLRAQAMAEVLTRAGIPIHDLVRRVTGKESG